jgi:serine/threonine-protein kinase
MDTKVADPLHGALLGGRYRIMGLLARGGMATVYQARDERLDRAVAVKIIHPDHAQDGEFLQRLADEAKTVAKLGHPNVVAVYDQGSHDGAPYVVMEYVRGRTLRQVLDDRRRLDPAESLAILEQMLAALAVAHRAGLVHRDVKPENVLVAPPPNGSGDLVDAVVKVADFGLAHAVDVGPRGGDAATGGQLLATAEYVAPELVSEGHADPRADVYSSGIVLFEMLTGRVPFDGARPADVAWQHVDQDVPAPSRLVPGLPQLVDDVVARSTRRDPAARPRDAAAMLAEIQAAREDLGALAGPTRALAHPTVIVPSVPATPGDARPSWARLPNPRRSATPSGPVPARTGHGWAGATTAPAGTARRMIEALPAPVGDGLRSARSWLRRLSATPRGRQQLTAIVIVAGLALATGGWWLGFGRYTEAPSFVQLTNENAQREAARLGFRIEYGAGIFREDVPIDTVVDQNPRAGGRVLKGGTITLVLSLGPERYAVPDVSGQSLEFALTQLRDRKLAAQEADGYSDTLPVGYVVGTDPRANELVPPSTVVTVFVARGPFPVHVPTVVGKQLPDAENQLKAAGFTVEVTRQDDESKPRDYVLSQDPQGGQGLPTAQGQAVKLVVANGPPGVPMPDFVNQSCTFARDQLQAMGFVVDVQGNDLEKQFGRVREQSPPPNQPVQQGQQVQIRCGIF